MILRNLKDIDNFSCINNNVENLINKHPDRIPVIVNPINRTQPLINKSKYLVPKDMTVAQFIHTIRRRLINFSHDQALFLFINNTIPKNSDSMISIYEKQKKDDKVLYVHYSIENAFG